MSSANATARRGWGLAAGAGQVLSAGLMVKGALNTAVFHKAIRLSNAARQVPPPKRARRERAGRSSGRGAGRVGRGERIRLVSPRRAGARPTCASCSVLANRDGPGATLRPTLGRAHKRMRRRRRPAAAGGGGGRRGGGGRSGRRGRS